MRPLLAGILLLAVALIGCGPDRSVDKPEKPVPRPSEGPKAISKSQAPPKDAKD